METVEHSLTVSVGFFFRVGSASEVEPEHFGISHLWEHMIFKGTASRSGLDIATQIDRIGGELNAYTDKYETALIATVPRFELNFLLELMAEMAFHSTFDAGELKKEVLVIQNEIASASDDAEEFTYEEFALRHWQGCGLAHSVAGDPHTIKMIQPDQLQAWAEQAFRTRTLVVAIAGSFDPSAALTALSAWLPAESSNFELPSWKPRVTQFVDFLPRPFNQTQVLLGVSFLQQADLQQGLYLRLFSSLFGESMSSRLFQEIREHSGLAYSIYSTPIDFPGLGGLFISSSTKPNQVSALLQALAEQWQRVVTDGFGPEEWEIARTNQIGALSVAFERNEAKVYRLFENWTRGGLDLSTEATLRLLHDLDFQAARSYLQTCLFSQPLSQLVVGKMSGQAR